MSTKKPIAETQKHRIYGMEYKEDKFYKTHHRIVLLINDQSNELLAYYKHVNIDKIRLEFVTDMFFNMRQPIIPN